jgi:Inhibitor of Apoptosis domain/PH domain
MAEDYDRAGALKARVTLFTDRLAAIEAEAKVGEMIETRKAEIADEVARLGQEKVDAAINEDYDRAAEIKDTILVLEAEKQALDGGGSLEDAAAAGQAKKRQIEDEDANTGSFLAPSPVETRPDAPPRATPAPVAAPSAAAVTAAAPAAATPFQPLKLSDIPQYGPDDIQSGFLHKKGGKRRNWKERWFKLEKGTMVYYESAAASSSKELGRFQVGGCTCFDDTTAHNLGANFVNFAVQTPKRTFVLSTPDARELDCWKAAIIAQGGIWDSPRASGDASKAPAPAAPAAQAPSPTDDKRAAERSRRARYADESYRLLSFKPAPEGGHAESTWPHASPTPEQCAAAGLYYQPHPDKPDRCRCYVCPAALYAWDADDDPISAHRMIKPNCSFVLEHS